jgi:hypothetical protein
MSRSDRRGILEKSGDIILILGNMGTRNRNMGTEPMKKEKGPSLKT